MILLLVLSLETILPVPLCSFLIMAYLILKFVGEYMQGTSALQMGFPILLMKDLICLLLMTIMWMELVLHMAVREAIFGLFQPVSQPSREGCMENCNWRAPSFVGQSYSCVLVDACTTSPSHCPLLWNSEGDQCVGSETFYRNLTQTTNDDIEMRVCRDQASTDEDILLTLVEIFVSP